MRLPGGYSDKLTVGLLISPLACSDALNTDRDVQRYPLDSDFLNFLHKFSILELLKYATTVIPNTDNIMVQSFDFI